MAYLPRFVIVTVGLVMVGLWPVSQIRGQAKRRQVQTSRVRQWPVLSPREIAAKISNSLVLIVTQDKEGEQVASGSGFFYNTRATNDPLSKISPHLPPGVVFADEEIVTSLHVFKRASQGYVKVLGEGVTYKITEIVAIDMQHDLCVFRASGASARPLTVVTGTKLAVGDDVYVAGNPRGLEATISKGIVSAIRTDRGLIQLDAAISPGSSGGPVVNARAEVVGIAASSLAEGQNLNFAVDANYLAALPLKWNVPVSVAGALALRDREKDKLKSLVHTVTTKSAGYTYDEVSQRYIEGPSVLRHTKTYDYDGNLTDQASYFGGELVLRRHFKYSERGLMIRRLVSGKLVRETDEAVTESDAINEKIVNAHHSSVSRMTGTDKNGSEIVIGHYTYDREGNEVETVRNDQQTGPQRTVRTFDRNGWETDEALYSEGKIQLVSRYAYKVDEHGNWIKRYSTRYSAYDDQLGFAPTEVVSRDIRYYDGR